MNYVCASRFVLLCLVEFLSYKQSSGWVSIHQRYISITRYLVLLLSSKALHPILSLAGKTKIEKKGKNWNFVLSNCNKFNWHIFIRKFYVRCHIYILNKSCYIRLHMCLCILHLSNIVFVCHFVLLGNLFDIWYLLLTEGILFLHLCQFFCQFSC